MRFISTKTHGYLDYLLGILLIASPWLFDFYEGGAESWVPIILGVGAILYSLFTDYEVSATRKISMKTHLTLDFLSGALLAVSPWLFGFSDEVYLPHLILGIAEILASLCTHTTPTYRDATTHNHHTSTTNRTNP